MQRDYGGIIWTNHALNRMKERGIKQGDAWATWKRPDQSRFSKNKGSWIYYKTYGGTRIEVVAKKNSGKWLVLSVWSRPAKVGTKIKRTSETGQSVFKRLLKFISGQFL